MTEQVFVARERELTQLNTFLDRALAGQGQICFVTGEAGAGKTALVTEFARRTQAQYDDLLVAVGQGDAQTGIGDPYLPFREVLGQLTGDVEGKLAQGAITQENAGRLRDFLNISGKALVDLGPDLIDIFVPGAGLVTRAGTFVAGKVGWLDRLKDVTEHKSATTADTGLDQSRIFEQYTNVLKALAAERPLIVVVDDLQWADAASINLLFRLGRQIEDSRILILGTYRPDDVALGRGGERHPLEPVLNELKRYAGDVWIDLGQAQAFEGRQFVDALLDREPNRLGEAFRQALFQHTGGHPLFTTELLRAMRERADLIPNKQGQWVEGTNLDWGTLPARVEGVIEERIRRLDQELREALIVASVEGEDFTAQVIAGVQETSERQLVRWLTRELDKQHRLVQEQGVERVGRQRLSLYRFRHNVFQRYLYNNLGESERAYLHEDVGNVLEELYGEQAEAIAVQLARHFVEAGRDDKALPYLIQAGDAAVRQYANTEAVAHYTRALEVAERGEATGDQLIHLYRQRGRALELNAQHEEALINYEEMVALARDRGDRSTELTALMAQVTLRATPTSVCDLAQAEALAERAVALARDLDDQVAEAKLLWNLLNVYRFTRRFSQAVGCGERSLALARKLDLREQMAFTLLDLAQSYVLLARFDRATEMYREASVLWRELDNLPMLADSLAALAIVHTFSGEFDQALTFSEEAFQISQSIHNLWGQSHSQVKIGLAYWERGRPDRAVAAMEDSIRLSERAGFILPQTWTQADLAAVYGSLGATEQGLETARRALDIAETQLSVFRPWVLAVLAHLHLRNDNLTEAEAAIEQGKEDLYGADSSLFLLSCRLAEAELALRRGDYERALALTDDLLADLQEFGARIYIPQALHVQGQALLALDETEEAQARLAEARAEAKVLGSRRMLWQILATLAEIEAQRGQVAEAENLRAQAREVIRFIVDHAGRPELRATFLNLPDVRAVLEDSTG
ncbi:MAG: tetratricopeptide repeat protein [Anaerolineae bacterium]